MGHPDAANLKTMVDYWDRLQASIAHAGVTLKDLQTHLDVSYQAMKKVADGKTKSLSAENNSHAARFLGVNAHWLATGEETMTLADSQIRGGQAANPSIQAHNMDAVHRGDSWPFESVSYAEYMQLSERQKGLIEGYAKRLIDESAQIKSNGSHKAA